MTDSKSNQQPGSDADAEQTAADNVADSGGKKIHYVAPG
jgi:hypothetical protein